MKINRSKLYAFTASLLSVLFLSTSVMATALKVDDKKNNKIVLKARAAVEEASPDDWHTLAESADKMFQKKLNLKEAASWIDRSLEIKETAYNLEVKGDYYVINKLPEEALKYYVKSIALGQRDASFNAGRVQDKIMKIKNAG